MSENRKRVLDMLAEGKVSVDEAERLLTAMGESTGDSGFSTTGAVRTDERKYLRVVVEPNVDAGPGEKQQRVNVRVPMALIRAGVKLTSLIPSNATTKINEELRKSGVDFDVSTIKTEDLEELVEALKDLEVDMEGGEEGKIRVYFE